MKDLHKLAIEIAEVYGRKEKVHSVMLAGSVSRGLCDEFSDIELYVLWDHAPSDEDRKDAMHQLDGTLISFFDYEDEEWSEAYSVQGVKIEVSNFLVSTIEKVIDDITIKMEMDIDKQAIVASVHDGIPLYGKEKIIEWKDQVKTYPEELRRNMIEAQLFFSSRWSAREAFIHRGDFFIYQKVASDVMDKVLFILHGLNGMYVVHPAFKWLSYTISKMGRKPEDLENRIKQIIHSPSIQSMRDLERLLSETMDLVETYMPSIETHGFRKQITGSRSIK
ncbi:DUF4037 domain-containing protein [Bacillus sp. FJAT-49736]|uniref:DUF4037 domain-containing protein n=1 Tax=Bacillus sp. FJAT-49736 TaxID=2833582 RepID=UPI001BC8E8F1|nr:DUF4037 domain-containing protein [Bacillus sp. FJAT-49736]MBS4174393.1 DUF4037 domain-containing protein [Bacillus sp. FJAT-49736]